MGSGYPLCDFMELYDGSSLIYGYVEILSPDITPYNCGAANASKTIAVSLADGVGWTGPLSLGTCDNQHDLNGDGCATIADASLVTPAISGAWSCTEPNN